MTIHGQSFFNRCGTEKTNESSFTIFSGGGFDVYARGPRSLGVVGLNINVVPGELLQMMENVGLLYWVVLGNDKGRNQCNSRRETKRESKNLYQLAFSKFHLDDIHFCPQKHYQFLPFLWNRHAWQSRYAVYVSRWKFCSQCNIPLWFHFEPGWKEMGENDCVCLFSLPGGF